MLLRIASVVVALGLAVPLARGQPAATQPSREFESPEAGLAVTLPPGDTRTAASPQPPADPQALAVVTDAKKEWRFELRSVPLDRPIPMRTTDLPEGGQQVGMLELSAGELQRRVNGDLLRLDLAPLPDADAGLFAVRYSLGPATLLRQDALIRANDTLYYRMTMTSPAPLGDVEAVDDDPAVREAVAAFSDAFNSFRTIDQSDLRQEQEERLFRTRAMMVNLKPRGRLAAACAGEQWWILKRDGVPAGFARVIEEPADALPPDAIAAFESPDNRPGAAEAVVAKGVRVGVRLRMRTPDGRKIDRATWSYASRDLAEGDFRELNLLRVAPDPEADDADEEAAAVREQQGLVIGQMRSRRVPRRAEGTGTPGLGRQPTFDLVDQRELEVTFTVDGHVVGDPMVRQLPAFYLPMAIDHLLPRLLATWGSDEYMVAVYAPERREVYSKYLDVADPAETKLPAGGTGKAIVVTTRLGYGGQETQHFVDPETFAWLGSKTPGAATQVYPATRDEVAAAFAGDELLEELTAEPDAVPAAAVDGR